MVAMTTSVAAATTITPGTTEPGKLTNIRLPIVAGMIIRYQFLKPFTATNITR